MGDPLRNRFCLLEPRYSAAFPAVVFDDQGGKAHDVIGYRLRFGIEPVPKPHNVKPPIGVLLAERNKGPLHLRSLAIRKKVLGPGHLDVASSLNNLAVLYKDQGRYAEAEKLFQRSQTITEKAVGPEHPDMARNLNNLALLYRILGRHAEAEPLFQRALTIAEKTSGPEHPHVATSLENYADLLRETGRGELATMMELRAKAIRAKHAQENPAQ